MSGKARCKIGICGHFGGGKVFLDGQTVKTKILTEELERCFGRDSVLTLDTYGGAKRLPHHIFGLIGLAVRCDRLVILPAQNSLRVFVPLLSLLNRFLHRDLHYAVIGGWLPAFLENRKGLSRQLKRFDGIYTETTTMKRALEAQGFTNVSVLPNCKRLEVLAPEQMVSFREEPYPLCTFSRVMQKKGIADAVEAVRAVNARLGRTAFTLDIYGQIDPNEEAWFARLQADFPEYVRYCGQVPFDESVQTVKKYFALLFPTRFYTEGIPGTIIDAYAAGVPVISARWESFADVVTDGVTGIGYPFGCPDQLAQILCGAAQDPELILGKKENCLRAAKDYLPEQALRELAQRLGSTDRA